MKTLPILGGILAVGLVAALPLLAQVSPPAQPRARASPHETVSVVIKGTGGSAQRLIVVYGRPNLKNPRGGEIRKVWGELVPYDRIWRLGADEATLLITPVALTVGSVEVAPGAYSLYMLPSESGASKLVINKMVGQWGLTYDEKLDVGRVDLKKEQLNAPVEQLTIALAAQAAAGTGTLTIAWESMQFSTPFTVKQ
jgi:hypothetical protein